MINLYYHYYRSPHDIRNTELDYSLRKLIENKKLDRIFIITDLDSPIQDSRITVLKHHSNRPTFHDYMYAANTYTSKDDVNIFMNSDCFILEESIPYLDNIKENEFWCLSRYHIITLDPLRTHFEEKICNQDGWVFRGKVKNLSQMNVNFPLGIWSCEYRMAFEAKRFYEKVINPSKTVKIYHYHPSEIRNHGEINLHPTKDNCYYIYPVEL